MKLTLVNPPVTREERYGDLASAGSYSPPLGLCSIAAVARAAGHDTAIIDAPVEGLDHDAALARIEELKPDVVGFTSTTSTFASGARLAGMIKENRPNTVVVAGGVHVSALPEACMTKFQAIDVGVLGEGEETTVGLLDALRGGTSLHDVAGIIFRENGRTVMTGPRPMIEDLDALPFPAWDLLAGFPEAYGVQAQSVANFPSTSVCTSRGCTGDCTFCDRRIFGKTLRAHSAEYVIDMVTELVEKFGVRDIQFEDDNFMLFRKRLMRFCDLLDERALNITWSCQARVDMVGLQALKRMRESGCWMILYGVESGSQRILDDMAKNITVDKIERAIELTHEAGISCKGFFITGYLTEDRKSLQETYDFIKRCKLDDISNHYFCPFPGSEAYEMLDDYGEARGSTGDMTFYKPVFIPRGLTEEDLVRHTKACYRLFYTKPRILLGYLKRVRRPANLLFFARAGLSLFRYLLKRKG